MGKLSFGERLAEIRARLEEAREKFEAAAVQGVEVDRYITLLLRACGQNSKVLDAHLESLATTLLESVSLGLPIGTSLGYGYVVPYKGRAQFQAGYQGLLKLAYNDGRATTAGAEVVREGDWFIHELGSEPQCRHKKTADSRPDAEIEWAWGCIHVAQGPPFVSVWNAADLKSHADKYVQRGKDGKFYSDSLIVTNYEAWCRKTMLRRCLKFMPMSETARLVLAREEYVEEGVDPEPEFVSGDEQGTGSLREALGVVE